MDIIARGSLFSLQTHLSFGREFTEAVEMKQVAQQDAERACFFMEKVSRQLHAFNTTTIPTCTFLHSL